MLRMRRKRGMVRGRAVIAVGVAGAIIASLFVFSLELAANPNCCQGHHPYVRLYDHPRSQLEAFLVTGDAQAFAALAQDPLLSRPEVIAATGEYAYRAQRPLWGYLAWVTSLAQPGLTGWALVLLAVLACGAACAIAGALLDARGASPWWALVVLAAGLQSLSELTPELLAFALLAAAVFLLERSRKTRWAFAFLCLAVLARESMLVGVGALALWELGHVYGGVRARTRAVAPFALPFLTYMAWAAILRARLGSWPTGRSEGRLELPFIGLLQSIGSKGSSGLAVGVLVAIALCISSLALASRDRLTWIALAFAAFATTFSQEVWIHAGYSRSLVPLYVFGTIATVGGYRVRATVRARQQPISHQISQA
jgi:hypothetical protein